AHSAPRFGPLGSPSTLTTRPARTCTSRGHCGWHSWQRPGIMRVVPNSEPGAGPASAGAVVGPRGATASVTAVVVSTSWRETSIKTSIDKAHFFTSAGARTHWLGWIPYVRLFVSTCCDARHTGLVEAEFSCRRRKRRFSLEIHSQAPKLKLDERFGL